MRAVVTAEQAKEMGEREESGHTAEEGPSHASVVLCVCSSQLAAPREKPELRGLTTNRGPPMATCSPYDTARTRDSQLSSPRQLTTAANSARPAN